MITKDYGALSLIVVFGIILILIGLWLKKQEDVLDKVGIKTLGKIVSFDLERAHISQSPEVGQGWVKGVEFETEKGAKGYIKSRLSSLPNDGLIGTDVPVIYDPANPQKGVIDTFIERKAPWLIFLWTGVGIIMSIAIVYLFIKK